MREPHERLKQLETQLELNAYYYTETDPANLTLGYFAKAALIALRNNPGRGFSSVVEHLLELRDDIDAPHAVKLLERGYQADLLEYDDTYPHGYQTEVAWLQAFSNIDVDHDLLRWGVLANNVTIRPLQSNIAERYKTIKLLASFISDRFKKPISHLDIGSSVMHGDYKLLYEANPNSPVKPFKSVEIVNSDKDHTPDERLTKLANVALRQRVSFGHVMGVDITDITDPGVKRWAKSCSFYPDELLKQGEIADYNILDHLDPDHKKAHFFQGDFADLDRRKFTEASPLEEWDLITFSTIFYQVSKQERLAMLVNASSILSENGLIIIQDARDGNFSKPFNYTTSVIDATARHNNPEEPLLLWENGRCNRAALGKGRLIVNGESVPTDVALKERFGTTP